MQDHSSPKTRAVLWGGLAIGLLLALRLPSLAHPAGADQSLYSYVGLRILDGGAPYVDAWDQKPPGIHLLYAVFWAIWPHESVVAAADLGAAAIVCLCLVVLGRRFGVAGGGWLAAAVFALLANPALQRLSGVFVRSQCETFIAASVAVGLVLISSPARAIWSRIAAGLCLGFAVWLKYNAVMYVLPLALAAHVARPATGDGKRSLWTELLWMMAGVIAIGGLGLGWLTLHGALTDLRLATFDYNLQYSGETYAGPLDVLRYIVTLPFTRARYDLLWYLGGAGLVGAVLRREARSAGLVGIGWAAAAIASIAVNGARDLPQYFVQAAPAFAFAAGVGLRAVWDSRRPVFRAVLVVLVVAGLWRVGTDEPLAGGIRLASLPGLVENLRFDLAYLDGRIDREMYLARFGGQRDSDKFAAADIEELTAYVRTSTADHDPILVFGFTPGAYVKAHRVSASRFFWSRPIVVEFATGRPGYGPAGLLADLEATPPQLIALQRHDWAETDSETYFLGQAELSGWLARHYQRESDLRLYSIWRRVE